jgi:hypothetical protein
MSFRTKLKEIEDSFNLTKRYPDYFNKTLWRTATVMLFVLFAISFITNDYKFNNVYIECNSDTKCQNPFYLCSNIDMKEINVFYDSGKQCLPKVTWKVKPLCDAGACDLEYLEPHQIIGNKPNFFNQYFALWIIILYSLTIIINHILYKRRK